MSFLSSMVNSLTGNRSVKSQDDEEMKTSNDEAQFTFQETMDGDFVMIQTGGQQSSPKSQVSKTSSNESDSKTQSSTNEIRISRHSIAAANRMARQLAAKQEQDTKRRQLEAALFDQPSTSVAPTIVIAPESAVPSKSKSKRRASQLTQQQPMTCSQQQQSSHQKHARHGYGLRPRMAM